ncbi:hypothetical protein [Poritiphilus flavus]|uniref:PKD domain-containing protein n=1 Tax=Poritiphilus flavus TaxID=2697053 RepID=A0A6L9EJD9_9FLAO|nr:hypothetical protein [Poritiphilus flavus]NAS14299.1 hypothetical protein [Poritiphilus flavus]
MATNSILDKQTPIYHRFVDNQVLTDDQLNAVLDHVNYQDKISRTSLAGVGIVCGLQISVTGNNIRLSGGIAVTTDGDLLKKQDTVYKGFKLFKDENVKYNHFLDGETVMELYELEEDTAPSDVFALSQFQTRTGITKDQMVALLYLEDFLKEEEDCSPVDCNAQGREVAQNLRVLVTSLSNAKKIAEKDSILKGFLDAAEGDVLGKIDDYLPKKVIINTGVAASLSSLKNAYFVQFDKLFNRILQLGQMSIFRDLVALSGHDLEKDIGKLKPHDLNFQYLYDFYKDLATAYNELLEALSKDYGICCPDPLAFPKHVILGEVHSETSSIRHAFYPSPTHQQEQSLKYFQKLFERMMYMIKHFLVSITKDTRITPSRNGHYTLGERAIPFYYNITSASAKEDLPPNWNPEMRKRPLNYYKVGYPTADFNPLNYCLEDHDFYRIEGHVGLEVQSVVKELQNLRAQNGLAFDIVPIAVGALADEDTIDYDKYNVFFEDLQVILQAWNEEQKCMISGSSKFLTRFSAVEKGAHLDYKMFATDALVAENNTDSGQPLAGGGTFSGLTAFTPVTRFGEGVLGRAGTEKAVAGTFARRAAKPKRNAVMDNMDSSEGSLGELYVKNLSTSDGGSDFQVKIDAAVKDTIKDWENEFQVAVAEIPGDLLGKLKVSEDSKLIDIKDFTEENLAKYIQALQKQCDAAKAAKKKLQNQVSKKDSAISGATYLENYFFVLNRIISSCCLVERVKVLYEKILERKEELLRKMLLKEYVKPHPGLEHKAGVERGGTFIVLYYSSLKPKPATSISASDVLTGIRPVETSRDIRNITGTPIGRFQPRSLVAESDIRRLTAIGNQPSIRDLALENLLLEGRFGTIANLSHGTVIGDLCLPYICCTDTPATTFVFPDQETFIFIAKDHLCVPFEGQGTPEQMEVTPVDGVVTAHVDNEDLAEVIVKKEGNFFFDPNQVPENLFGKTIKFRVNGQNVTEELVVLRKPDASFAISEKVDFRNDNTSAVITIKNTSKDIDGQEFSWDFGQGGIVKQDALEFTHKYAVTPGGTFSFDIKLTAENGRCTDTATQTKVINVPKTGNEPVNCQKETADKINTAKLAIETDLEKHPSALKNGAVFYQENFTPLYKILLTDIESSLKGELDSQLYKGIQTLQRSITERLTVNLPLKEQEFTLRLYYENMLLYFYLQLCREGKITSRNGIPQDWVSFTKNAVDTFIEPLKMLFELNPIPTRLLEIRSETDERLSGGVRNNLDEVLETFKGTFG